MDCNPPGSSIQRFPRKEYWSGLPGPPPGDLPDPEIELGSLVSPYEIPGALVVKNHEIPGALVVKNLPANAGDATLRFNPWVGTIPWKWQPTPVFLPGESHGQRSLVGYSPWGDRDGHD